MLLPDVSYHTKKFDNCLKLKDDKKHIVLSGAFSTGKSSVVKELDKIGYPIMFETSRRILDVLNIQVTDIKQEYLPLFQTTVLNNQIKDENTFKKNGFISDTGILDNLAYSKDLPNYEELLNLALKHNKDLPYDTVFYFPPLGNIENDGLRHTDIEFQKEINNRLLELYKLFGYKVITLENDGNTLEEKVQKRVNTIINHLDI